jgi:hypothetical protein
MAFFNGYKKEDQMAKNNILKLSHVFMLFLIVLYLPLNSMAQMNTWKKKTDIEPLSQRWWFPTATLNGKIYIMGGYVGGGVTSLVNEYDPVTDNLEYKAYMPVARGYGPCLAFDGKIYVFGGYVYNTHALSRIDVYDPDTDTWTTIGDMTSPRAGMGASIVNGKIYVVGGFDNSQNLSTMEEYDPVTGIWNKKTDMPTKRQLNYNNAPVVNGKIYIIGGAYNNPQVGLSVVEEYDPATDTWTTKSDMPTPRWAFGISEVNGKIFVIGGSMSTNPDWSMPPLATVEMYDPVTDKWSKMADMPSPRTALSATAIGAYIYVFGDSSAVEVYDTGLGMEVKTVSPQEAYTTGGTPIAISGSGFPSDLIVTIGGKPLSDQKVTYSLITGIIPPNTEGEKDIVFTVPSFTYSTVAGQLFYKLVSNIVMTKITPNNGKQAGGDTASISGSGFLNGATVTVGGNPGTGVVVTPTLITFRVPSGTEGTKDVVVTNPDGQRGILRNSYTYNPFPIISGIAPSYGGPLTGGTEVTIGGENFMSGVTVYIGSERVSKLDFFSSTELRLLTPAGTEGMKPVRVVNPDGQEAVEADGFRYNYPPSIFSIEPTAGALEGGTWVTITGSHFDVWRVKSVYVGEIEAWVEFMSAKSITIVTPPSTAGTKDVMVINQDGQKYTLKEAFTYNPAPVITGITPKNGKPSGGTKITIQGSGFMPEAKVFIGDVGQNDLVTIYAAVWSE